MITSVASMQYSNITPTPIQEFILSYSSIIEFNSVLLLHLNEYSAETIADRLCITTEELEDIVYPEFRKGIIIDREVAAHVMRYVLHIMEYEPQIRIGVSPSEARNIQLHIDKTLRYLEHKDGMSLGNQDFTKAHFATTTKTQVEVNSILSNHMPKEVILEYSERRAIKMLLAAVSASEIAYVFPSMDDNDTQLLLRHLSAGTEKTIKIQQASLDTIMEYLFRFEEKWMNNTGQLEQFTALQKHYSDEELSLLREIGQTFSTYKRKCKKVVIEETKSKPALEYILLDHTDAMKVHVLAQEAEITQDDLMCTVQTTEEKTVADGIQLIVKKPQQQTVSVQALQTLLDIAEQKLHGNKPYLVTMVRGILRNHSQKHHSVVK